jgi:UDPglucose 6-dehydrogenase
MKIAVVGTGYVGLVTGTCFAETGNHVICVDIDAEKVAKMKAGKVPIYEPGLETLFERNIKQGRLVFTTELEEAVHQSDIIFLALPTPPGADGSADLSFILKVASQLGKMIWNYKIIIDKSTVPVGTAEKVQNAIAEKTDIPFDVVSNPEFLREGFAVNDFMKPDRVVIGTSSEKARGILGELYKPFVRQGNPVLFMDEKSAELTKYAANSFLATKITFMNEIANFCEKVGADVDSVRIGIGSDTRIGKRFLFPGIGFGGSCFPKDVQALVKSGKEYGYLFNIIDAVLQINDMQKLVLVEKLKDYFRGKLKDLKIGLWGLAFKPETDDIREAPALYIIEELLKEGVEVSAFDPEAMENVKMVFGDRITFCDNQYDVLQDADALMIATEWSMFRSPDFEQMKEMMKQPVIFDGRNLYDTESMKQSGFYYSSIGRKIVSL